MQISFDVTHTRDPTSFQREKKGLLWGERVGKEEAARKKLTCTTITQIGHVVDEDRPFRPTAQPPSSTYVSNDLSYCFIILHYYTTTRRDG